MPTSINSTAIILPQTVVGEIRFGPDGEWAVPRPLFVQYQNIRANDLEHFRGTDKVAILSPPAYKTGELIWPFNDAWRPNAVESDAQRWQSTVLGFQAWLAHPIFGNGLGAFLLDREAAGLPALVIHSVPVWFLAEMGVVGLAGYVFFVASLLYCGISALLRQQADGRGLLIILASFVLMGFVHDIFYQRTFWFACSLVLLNMGPIPGRPREEASRRAPAASDTSGASVLVPQ